MKRLAKNRSPKERFGVYLQKVRKKPCFFVKSVYNAHGEYKKKVLI